MLPLIRILFIGSDHMTFLTVKQDRSLRGLDLQIALDDFHGQLALRILVVLDLEYLGVDLLECLVTLFLGTSVLVLLADGERLAAVSFRGSRSLPGLTGAGQTSGKSVDRARTLS